MPATLALSLNALALYAFSALLIVAFGMQIGLHELPCPLCMMQRALFCAMGAGFILNIRHGVRAGHYALSMLAALLGGCIALRQVFLHILPGDPGYGSTVAGLHYYTWAALVFLVALVVMALLLLPKGQPDDPPPVPGLFARTAVWLLLALTVANLGSTVLMCGFEACPDDPVRYRLL